MSMLPYPLSVESLSLERQWQGFPKLKTAVQEGADRLANRFSKKSSTTSFYNRRRPRGATFEGTIYRSVKIAYDPLEMSQYTTDSDHRHTEKGIPGLYFSSGEKISKYVRCK